MSLERLRALVVCGLGFGDEGKGSIVDWLVRRHAASTVVRYNGGPQAAHHVVVRENGAFHVHCAAQLGSGVFSPGVRTHLSRFVLVDPLALRPEAAALAEMGVPDALARLTIDPRSIVVTPIHAAANRMLELARGQGRHGSCGRGVAQAQLDAERGAIASLCMRDLFDEKRLGEILRAIWLAKVDLGEQLLAAHTDDVLLRRELAALKQPDFPRSIATAFHEIATSGDVRLAEAPPLEGTIVLEGAQGVLLDRDHGFFPYVTPSRTTFANAATFLAETGRDVETTRIGLLRAYATRHGAGPLLTEDAALGAKIPDLHNGTHPWQGKFRVGAFDVPAARYALRVAAATGPVDALIVTNADRLAKLDRARAAVSYTFAGDVVRDFPASPVRVLAADDPEKDALTRWWSACSPNYVEVPRDPEAFAAWLESDAGLGAPVVALSLGPTHEDKHVRRGAPRVFVRNE